MAEVHIANQPYLVELCSNIIFIPNLKHCPGNIVEEAMANELFLVVLHSSSTSFISDGGSAVDEIVKDQMKNE